MRNLASRIKKLENVQPIDKEDAKEVYLELDSSNLHPLDKTKILIDLGLLKPETVLNWYLEGCKKFRD